MSTQLDQIAKKAKSNPKLRFTSLAHLLTPSINGKKGIATASVAIRNQLPISLDSARANPYARHSGG